MYVNEFNQAKLCICVTTFNEITLKLRGKESPFTGNHLGLFCIFLLGQIHFSSGSLFQTYSHDSKGIKISIVVRSVVV